MKRWIVGIALLALLAGAERVRGATILLAKGIGGVWGYSYGESSWGNFTAALDSATGNQVHVTSNFENLSEMMGYDALLLEQRWTTLLEQHWTTGSLTANEISNLMAFIATGRRVVMFGENSYWTSWNNQILGIVGGTFVEGSECTGDLSAVLTHEITALAPTVYPGTAGLAGTASGTPLYNANFATLWGGEMSVLTILDVNVVDDDYWAWGNNGQFATNVANWLAEGGTVPEPSTLVMFAGLGAMGLIGAWRRRKSQAA